MDLTGGGLLTLVIILAVAMPVVTLTLWSRIRGARPIRDAQRLALIGSCQITAVLLTAVLVNNHFVLYESWSDLFGSDNNGTGTVQRDPAQAGAVAGSGSDPSDAGKSRFPTITGSQRVVSEQVRGPHSGVDSKIWVVLPAEYNQPSKADTRYPVVMFLPGYPGTPTTWLHAMQLQSVMDSEIASGRVKPFIAVLPTMNVAATRDTECTDIPAGPQVSSWLGIDVPEIVHEQTRSLPPGTGWGVTGYSTGGFCSAKLVLTHPQSFRSAAVLAGYYTPSGDATTGDLYGGSQQLWQANNPMWLVANQDTPASHLLAVWSEQDPSTAEPTQAFLRAVRPPLRVDQLRLTRGGHNTAVWLGVLPQVLRWLSGHLTS